MTKTLGLDLGTNSIGWAVVDDENKGNKIQDKGVLIFSEGVKKEKGQEKSKAAERTTFRSARRLKFRRKIRKYQTLLVLAKYGMCPLSIEEVKEWRKSNFKKYPARPEFLEWLRTEEEKQINPYYFRDKASRKKVNKYDLGRALYHIAQRRGFLSNRLDQSDKGVIEKHQPELEIKINEASTIIEIIESINEYFEPFDILEKKQKELDAGEQRLKMLYNSFSSKLKENLPVEETKIMLLERLYKKEFQGEVKKGITKLDEVINDPENNCETLGQYFWKIYQEDRNNTENKIRKNYTSREEHYLTEFEIICKAQGFDGINETKKDASERYTGIVKELYKAIFYQRPLKSQKGLVGKCSLEQKRTRCSVSRPEYEQFRMYSFINNIKIKAPEEETFRFLTKDEKERIIPKFYRKSKPSFAFEDIKKILGENIYNYKDKTTVSGCPTIASLINVFGDNWEDAIFQAYKDKSVRDRKTKEIVRQKTRNEVVTDIWHVLSTFTSAEKLKEFAVNKLELDEKSAGKFSKIHLKKEYASLSLYAIEKILGYLKPEKGLPHTYAVFMANMDKIIKPEHWKNQETRRLIENEVGNILDNHREENKINFSINSLLKNCFDNKFSYSKEAEEGYRNDLEMILQKEFGEKTWSSLQNKNEAFENAYQKFIKALQRRKHISIKRIDEKIKTFLEDNDLIKASSFQRLYHPSDLEKFKPETVKDKNNNEYQGLGSPDIGSIKNPMAMRTLYQLRKLVNTLILENKIDENTKVNIELVRELNDSNKRKAIERWQNDRKELFREYEKKIKELYKVETGKEIGDLTNNDIEKFGFALEQREDGKIVSKEDLTKYKLWEEQNHICIYTGKTISLAGFLDSNPAFDIEHTLPRSRSWDNSLMNKTLCNNKFNREIKKNLLPTELNNHHDILTRINHWKERYEDLHNEIERLKRQSRNASDKEQKDRIIQKRNYLQMDYNYWKGKYDRFTKEEITEGFKNSQYVDAGIISKYAVAYMKSIFNKVYAVKGEMVDQYRKAWGLHDTFKDKWGRTQYKPKDRSNHIHHCIDAVTIACLDKGKYDKLAHVWGLEDKGDFNTARKELEKEKPWVTFTEDVKNLVNEVFIVHQNKDVLPIQTKKKFRKRGKIRYRLADQLPDNFLNKKEGKDYFIVEKNGRRKYKVPIFQQGDTVRGSLHLDTFYGAIANDSEGNIDNEKPKYVVRKELSKLKKSDVENIVDKNIRQIIEQSAQDKKITLGTNGSKVNEPIWQNEEKGIPLKKVRVYMPSVKSPLKDFKKHASPFLSKKEYKQQFNVANEENYCIAIYEGLDNRGKPKRDFELVNNIDAGEYYKLSSKSYRENHDLVPNPHLKSGLPLKFILKKGMIVLMYEKTSDEILEIEKGELTKRLYRLAKFDSQGRLTFRPHSEARPASDLKEVYGINISELQQQVRLQVSKLNILVEEYDFRITPTGRIERIR